MPSVRPTTIDRRRRLGYPTAVDRPTICMRLCGVISLRDDDTRVLLDLACADARLLEQPAHMEELLFHPDFTSEHCT